MSKEVTVFFYIENTICHILLKVVKLCCHMKETYSCLTSQQRNYCHFWHLNVGKEGIIQTVKCGKNESKSKLVGDSHFNVLCTSFHRSQDSYQQYVESMPWLCIPWQQAGVRAELAELYGIRGIPTLLLLDSNGHVITMDARTEIAEDPLAQVIYIKKKRQLWHVSVKIS